MSKLPREPDVDRLRNIEPSLTTIPAGRRLYRVYKRGGDHPTQWNAFRHYGPLSRFDHHHAGRGGDPYLQDRGVLYAAADVPTAVAEFFQRNRRCVNRTRHQPWLVTFALAFDVRLLDLTGSFCRRAGASAKLVSGPFTHAQNWSRGFYDAYPRIDGLYYLSSLTNRPSVALYERANEPSPLAAGTLFHRALADPLLHQALTIVVEEIGYGLI